MAGFPIRVSPLLLLAVAPLCWAGNFVIGRAMHADIDPAALTFWRWAVAVGVLVPLAGAMAWRCRRTILAAWRLIAVLAVTGVFGFQFCVYQGLHTASAINAALIIAAVPAIIPVVAFIADGARIGRRQGCGIAISMAGVAVIILQGNIASLGGMDLAIGDLWIALAACLWSVYSVAVIRRPADLPPWFPASRFHPIWA